MDTMDTTDTMSPWTPQMDTASTMDIMDITDTIWGPCADLCLRQDVGLWQDASFQPEPQTSCHGRTFGPLGLLGA